MSYHQLQQAKNNEFLSRHNALTANDQEKMLSTLGYKSLDDLMTAIIPSQIARTQPLPLADAISEDKALEKLKQIANKNKVFRSFIGQGYYGTITPNVILRNILENPAWYTAYTPYQPEISQGRLEAIINFQQMITDLTGMDIANGSMLDEGTAAAEAMTLLQRVGKSTSNRFFIMQDVLPQTIEVIQTRAKPLNIEVIIGTEETLNDLLNQGTTFFGILLQYPTVYGCVNDYKALCDAIHAQSGAVIVAADLLALTMLKAPGTWGADVVVGNSQRFGVPFGFGGPHAGFLATKDAFKRSMPGRLVGVSKDVHGNTAYRLALQTREQHIRREKATSNICTAQVLLAVIASMYAVYHGPVGLKNIAKRVHRLTAILAAGLSQAGFNVTNKTFFDTITVHTATHTDRIYEKALAGNINLRLIADNDINNSNTKYPGGSLGISLDETATRADVELLWSIFGVHHSSHLFDNLNDTVSLGFAENTARDTEFLTHPTFNSYHDEHSMLRYLRRLSDKDLALDRTMIPLGSCTMKLNATAEMIPVTWPEFGKIHPFAPDEQTQGYQQMIDELERMLEAATGYDAVSLQPNAGSQGEYAGLLMIKAYHESRHEGHRNICLIPSSAHGTNPASAQMAGMTVVVVACDEQGNVDMNDLKAKVLEHSTNLAAIMITYPSTHGVFEASVVELCALIHEHGGQVYIDGANMNALVGTASPGHFGGDVSHLNLHKTFCIPHGGGGPGVGPVAVKSHLAPFLPNQKSVGYIRGSKGIGAVSAAPFGSASILPISWMYITMMGGKGLTQATQHAILSANYVAQQLKDDYPILYTGQNGLIAHECILDIRGIKDSIGISNEDVAKRLMDFGFHAPTMSFPVAGTLMVEPTESEPLEELNRFITAMKVIREEIRAIENGTFTLQDNPLVNAPHTAECLLASEWNHTYSRHQAAYPVASLTKNKYWPTVGRIDNVYGDRNLFCSCVPLSEY